MLWSILQWKYNAVTIKLLLLQLFFSFIKRSGHNSQGETGNASGNSENRHRTDTRPSKDPSSTGMIHCISCMFYTQCIRCIFMNIDEIYLACSSHLTKSLQKRSFFGSGKICACQLNSLTQSSPLATSVKISIGCSFLL